MLVAKRADQFPLYRQEQTFTCAGVKIPHSTQAEWVGVCGARLQALADPQQLNREPDPAHRPWAQELAVRGFPAGGCRDESGSVDEDERA